MPTAQEIRTYLEKNGIQAALTTAVNEAIQAQAPNALEFIGDSLKAKAASGGAAAAKCGGDEGNTDPVGAAGEGAATESAAAEGAAVEEAAAEGAATEGAVVEEAAPEGAAVEEAVVEEAVVEEAAAEGAAAEGAAVEEATAEGAAEGSVSLEPPPAAEEKADAPASTEVDAPASTAASPEPDDFFEVCMMPPTPSPHPP